MEKTHSIHTLIHGFFIGLAMIVPGISGATIAIILKIYNKILYSLSSLFKNFKSSITFLFPLLIGSTIGLIFGILTIKKLLEVLPFTLIAFFVALMSGSLPIITKEIKKYNPPKKILLISMGLLPPILLLILSFRSEPSVKILFHYNFIDVIRLITLGYVIAITQIVPGLSGTALLMAIGYLKPLLETINLNVWFKHPIIFVVYLIIFIGFILGIISSSKILNYLLENKRKEAYSIISGLAIGSVFTMIINEQSIQLFQSLLLGNKMILIDFSLGIITFILGILFSKKLRKYI